MCVFRLQLQRFRTLLSVALFGMVYSTSVMAVGTDAGTPIDNFATVDFKVGGVDQTAVPSNTTSFMVDQLVHVSVDEADSGDTAVSPGQTGAIARFTVTNLGNEVQDYDLTVANLVGGTVFSLDTIDATSLTIAVDADGDDVYTAGTDTATFIDELSADDLNPDPLLDNVVSVFILANIPAAAVDTDAANIRLDAVTHEGGAGGIGAIQTETVGNDTAGLEIVFDAATGSADDGYLVGSATLAAVKTSVVISDPLGRAAPVALAIPGAVVEYTVTITNTGGTAATNLIILDDIQAEVTLLPGQYSGGGDVEIVEGSSAAIECTVASDADGCVLTGTTLTVSIVPTGPDPDGLSVLATPGEDVAVIRFRVVID